MEWTSQSSRGRTDTNPDYREFALPLMQKIRRQTFGEDIGLHDWVAHRKCAQTLRASTFPHPTVSLISVAAPAVH